MTWGEETPGSIRRSRKGKAKQAIILFLVLSILIIPIFTYQRIGIVDGPNLEVEGMMEEKREDTRTSGPITLTSPTGTLSITISTDQKGILYNFYKNDRMVIENARMGLILKGRDPFPNGSVSVIDSTSSHTNREYTVTFAEREQYVENYRSMDLHLKETSQDKRELVIRIRAYDEGIAFRYQVPKQENVSRTTITGEMTSFSFLEDHWGYAEYGVEGEYGRVRISKVRSKCEVPFTFELDDGSYMSIGEANLQDYSRMLLRNSGNGSKTLNVQLNSRVVRSPTFSTPWRVILTGRNSGELVENSDILYSLCPPSLIEDTSWIVPGKAFRDCSLTTNGSKAIIDYCAEHNMQYVHLDAGWYGKEHSSSDATTVGVSNLSIPEIVEYGNERDVGVILYVNNRSLRKQLSKIMPLYEEWGIKGVKFGFIDGRTQSGINFIHAAVKKAAEHHLLVVIHDNYRPTGLTRSYPNIMTIEGVRGNEHFPTSNHNTILPYSRAVCGPLDYTPRFHPSKDKTTLCHQMALPLLYFSPVSFLYWYQDPGKISEVPGTDLWDKMPTTWDNTTYLEGVPGKYASALRMKNDTWYYGMITGSSWAISYLDLGFLEAGRIYTATIYSDLNGTIDIKRYIVDRSTVIEKQILPNSGLCLYFETSNFDELEHLKRYPNWSKETSEFYVYEDTEMIIVLYSPGNAPGKIDHSFWTDADFISFDPISGILHGTPENDEIGTYHVALVLNYDGEPIGDIHMVIHVENVNDPPIMIGFPQYVETTLDEDLLIQMQAYDVDPTEDELTWDIGPDCDFIFPDPVNKTLRISPQEDDLGIHCFDLRVEDGRGGNSTERLTIMVREPERTITLNKFKAPIFVLEDVPFWIDLENKTKLNSSELLEWALVEEFGFLVMDHQNGVIIGSPSQNSVGFHTVTVQVSDDNWNLEVIEFELIVSPWNDPPAPLEDSIVIITQPSEIFSLKIPVIDEDDPPEALEWSIGSQTDLVIVDPRTGWIRGRSDVSDLGAHFIEIFVEDPSGNRAVIEISLLVLEEVSDGFMMICNITDRTRNLSRSDTEVHTSSTMIMIPDNSTSRIIAVPMSDELHALLSSLKAGDEEEKGSDPGSSDMNNGRLFLLLSILIISILVMFPLLRYKTSIIDRRIRESRSRK